MRGDGDFVTTLVMNRKFYSIYIVAIASVLIFVTMYISNSVKPYNISYAAEEVKTAIQVEQYLNSLFLSNTNIKYIYKEDLPQGDVFKESTFLDFNHPLVEYILSNVSGKTMSVGKELSPDRVEINDDLPMLVEIENTMYEEYREPIAYYEEVNQVLSESVYTIEELSNVDFLTSKLYTVDRSIKVNDDDFDIPYFLNKEIHISKNENKPTILIYHTHAHEDFKDSVEGEGQTVVGVGEELTRILEEKYGYEVYHLTKAYDVINGVVDRSKAYEFIKPDLKKILEENPSIELMIDLHRDGVPENVVLRTEIDGETTAKIMYFNALGKAMVDGKFVELESIKNPYVKDNMALSMQMQLKAMELYPGFTRKIYLRGYRYNLHLIPNSMLIEVGAQTNTYEEALNAMEPLAKTLDEVMK